MLAQWTGLTFELSAEGQIERVRLRRRTRKGGEFRIEAHHRELIAYWGRSYTFRPTRSGTMLCPIG